MRKILFLLVLMIVTVLSMQGQSPAPGIFNYQGVARNSVGNVLVNKTITLRLTLRDGGVAGPLLYQESRTVTTNPFGLFNVQVGSAGAVNVTGSIPSIAWGVNTKFIQVEIDPNGGSSFINIGAAQIASVPYALYSSFANDLILPFNRTQADNGSLFRIVNSGNATGSTALEGVTNSAQANAAAIIGIVSGTGPGGFSAGVRGINNGTGGNGIGVYGSQAGSGWGVYGTTPSGRGVFGQSNTGVGLYGSTVSGRALRTDGAIQLTGINEALNRILASDAAGNATWQDPSAIGIVSGSGTLNFIPKWTPNGTTLGNSQIFDNGTNIGIGTTTPTAKLSVNELFKVLATGTVQFANGVNPMMIMFETGTTNADKMVVSHSPGFPTWGIQYQDATDKFNFLSGGVQVMTVDLGNQNIGINQVAPVSTNKLHVNGTGTVGAINLRTSIFAGGNLDGANGHGLIADGEWRAIWGRNLGAGLRNEASGIRGEAGGTGYITGAGVLGTSIGPGTSNSGVVGIASGSAGQNYGLRGQATGVNAGFNWGTFASASGSTTQNVAIGGQAPVNANSWAGAFFGRVNITDGTQGLNRIFTSDAFGTGSWQPLGAIGGVGGSGTLNFVAKWTPDGFNIGNSQIFDNGTLVGINTGAAPFAAKVDLVSEFQQIMAHRAIGVPGFEMYYNNTNVYNGYIGTWNVSTSTRNFDVGTGDINNAGSLNLVTQAAPRMTILPNGNVGVGTLAASTHFNVFANSGVATPQALLEENGDDFARLNFKTTHANNSGNNFWAVAGYNNNTRANERLNFYNNATGNLMSITGTGNVGIGTTNPGGKLNVVNTGLNHSVLVNHNDVAGTANGVTVFSANPTAAGFAEGNAIYANRYVSGLTAGWWTTPTTMQVVTGTNMIGIQSSNENHISIAGNTMTGTGVLGAVTGATGAGLSGLAFMPTAYALVTSGRVQISGQGAANNRILTSDAVGNATWQDASGAGIVGGSGTLNFIPKWTPNGTTLGNSLLFDNGNTVSVGSTFTANNSMTLLTTPGSPVEAGLGFVTLNAGGGVYLEDATEDLHVTLNNNSVSGGTKVMTFEDVSLNVGIGTVTPTSKFHIDNTGTGKGGFLVNQDSEMSMPAGKVLTGGPFTGLQDITQNGGVFSNFNFYSQRGVYTSETTWFLNTTGSAIVGVSPDLGAGIQGTTESGVGVFAATHDGIGLRAFAGDPAGRALVTSGRVQITGQGAANGNILTSDAAGNATWETQQVSIRVNGLSSSVTVPNTTHTLITQWQTVSTEEGGANYNSVAGEYTITKNGTYNINARLFWATFTAPGTASVWIWVNGVPLDFGIASATTTAGSRSGTSISSAMVLNAGDIITIRAYQDSGASQTVTTFGGPGGNGFTVSLEH